MSKSGISTLSRLPLVVILGATGAGKSKLALEIAIRYNGEIISADSMQVYKKLDIITNKVTAAERKLCPHHLIDCISPLNTGYNVVTFRNTALPIIDGIFSRSKIPVIVGGTNYYIEALLWDLLVDSEESKADPVVPPGERKEQQEELCRPPGECDVSEPKRRRTSSSSSGGETGGEMGGDTAEFDRESLENSSTEDLYQTLWKVDPKRAKQLHPNNRRKIIRSLEVFYRTGNPISAHLDVQHTDPGGISGALRYKDPCVIWVQSDQTVLDARTDKRVDEMIDQGLIQEMTEFHMDYNQSRIAENKEADYTHGIFQSIGFKEFHEYLMLCEEDRASEKGQAALKKGVEDMKRATRQYARRQLKWMTNRFLKRRGGNVPPVYAVDSTDPTKWQENVSNPAYRVMESFLEGTEPDVVPLPIQENENVPVYEKCDICDMVFLTSKQWQAHMNGRKHKKKVQHKNRQLKKTQLESEHSDRNRAECCDPSMEDDIKDDSSISSDSPSEDSDKNLEGQYESVDKSHKNISDSPTTDPKCQT